MKIEEAWEDYSDGSVGDQTKLLPRPSIFMDPRDLRWTIDDDNPIMDMLKFLVFLTILREERARIEDPCKLYINENMWLRFVLSRINLQILFSFVNCITKLRILADFSFSSEFF